MSSFLSAPINDLDLKFGHQVYPRNNHIVIYFKISNLTLKEYRYYYFNFRPFGSFDGNEFLPRQRLLDTYNSLRIIGLHEGDYVTCVSLIDEYENIFKPRYGCYEFTLGEKTVGSHHGSQSNYLAPLLFAFAFVLHVIIAVVHYIKSKQYAQKLLKRFIDVSSQPKKRKVPIAIALKDLDKELDHPHLSASVQRRLSRVTIEANYDNTSSHRDTSFVGDPNDELPLYTLPHHSRRASLVTMQAIPENQNPDTIDSALSVRHLVKSVP